MKCFNVVKCVERANIISSITQVWLLEYELCVSVRCYVVRRTDIITRGIPMLWSPAFFYYFFYVGRSYERQVCKYLASKLSTRDCRIKTSDVQSCAGVLKIFSDSYLVFASQRKKKQETPRLLNLLL